MSTSIAAPDGGRTGRLAPVIHREGRWFDVSSGDVVDLPQPRISASRWIGHAEDRCEHEAEIAPDCHVIGIALRPVEEVTVFAARKLIQTGHLPSGSVRVNEPGLPLRGIFRGSYDVLHLRVPNTILAEYAAVSAKTGCGQKRPTPLICDHPIVDQVIERLARALNHAEELGGTFGESYADGISLAITAKLFGGTSDGASTQRSRVSGLAKWRMKRATEYIAAHLAEPISLADIAAATGLSRMHFAAQFRAATGLRPHEYLLQRRIERARELLLNSRLPLVEIAFEVGFKTQAHFTTVFTRLVGETPNVWRQRNHRVSGTDMLRAA
jgi:AraC family transcriptional regulator